MAEEAFKNLKEKPQDPLTKKPRLSRTSEANKVIKELKKLKKVSVKLNKVSDDSEYTIEVPSFTDSEPLYAGTGGGGVGRFICFTLTKPGGGVLPTEASITTDIETAYTSNSITPVVTDYLVCAEFVYIVGPALADYGTYPSPGFASVTFTVSSVNYRAIQIGPHKFWS